MINEELRQYHEVANIFPLMTGEEFNELKRDIAENGLREPIWLHADGRILDGRNRHRACVESGIAPIFRTWDGKGSLVSFVLSLNLHRRHLTSGQRAMVAVDILPMLEEEAKERQVAAGGNGVSGAEFGKLGGRGNRNPLDQKIDQGGLEKDVCEKRNPQSAKQAAEIVGSNHQYVSDAKKIAERSPELAEKVRAGEVSIAQAKREITKIERVENPPPPIQGKYRVWYADPPWHYGNSGVINDDGDNYGRAERHYPTMTIDELCAMGEDIKGASESDAVLFMWVTSPLLEECFPVIKSWGFKYKSSFVWDKVKHNFAHYNSMRHEFLLVCTKGSCTPDVKMLIDSVQSIERSDKHSEKPKEFREIIDTLYPNGNRIELFSRTQVDGWDLWGNEKI